MLQTSGKQFNKHSGGVIKGMFVFPICSILHSQKQSSLPPVVTPHIGSFSSLYLDAGVFPKRIWGLGVSSMNFRIYHLPIRKTEINCPMNAPTTAINI